MSSNTVLPVSTVDESQKATSFCIQSCHLRLDYIGIMQLHNMGIYSGMLSNLSLMQLSDIFRLVFSDKSWQDPGYLSIKYRKTSLGEHSIAFLYTPTP